VYKILVCGLRKEKDQPTQLIVRGSRIVGSPCIRILKKGKKRTARGGETKGQTIPWKEGGRTPIKKKGKGFYL